MSYVAGVGFHAASWLESAGNNHTQSGHHLGLSGAGCSMTLALFRQLVAVLREPILNEVKELLVFIVLFRLFTKILQADTLLLPA